MPLENIPVGAGRRLDLATRGNVAREQGVDPGLIAVFAQRVTVDLGEEVNVVFFAELCQ